MKPIAFSRPWTTAEDRSLLLDREAGRTFHQCSQALPYRSEKACKARYAALRAKQGAPDEEPVLRLEEGSFQLLRAQLVTGQHFITSPDVYRQRCKEVGL